jgi:hypothetical protein
MSDSFTDNDFTVEQTSTGVTITPTGGSPISVTIPDFSSMGVDFTDSSTFHEYVQTYEIAPTSFISSQSVIWDQLLREPAPLLLGETPPASPVTDGSTSHVVMLGDVTHYVDDTDDIVTNVTQTDHLLNPGAVVRYLYESDGNYYITTIGFGNGDLGALNDALSGWVWGGNTADIARASIYASAHSGSATGFLSCPIPTSMTECLAPWALAPFATDPLVVDLSSGHTGVTLTTFDAAATTTFYDLNNTGFAEQTAWTSGSTGFLVHQNTDGTISLLGASGGTGFADLASFDSDHNLKIDANDSQWTSLKVWEDSNGNGVVDSGELVSLSSVGIVSIDLAGVTASTSTIDGNAITQTSTVTFSDGSTAEIADANLVHSAVNTVYQGSYTFDTDTLFLPDLRGYGTLPELAVAMSQDSTLKTDVEDFVSGFAASGFASFTDSDIANILYQWAGVEGVSTDARGPYVNAQQLEFLEHLFGQNYFQFETQTANP